MNELVKAVGHVVTRDLVYVVAGSFVLVSFLYTFGLFSTAEMPLALQLFLAGVSYVLGYACQEAFGLLRITSTEHSPSPPRLARWLHWRFTRKEWTNISVKDYFAASATFAQRRAELGDEAIYRFNRIITLKHIGAAMGSAGTVSVAVLAWKVAHTRAALDIALVLGVALASAVMLAISWIKRLDESQAIVALANSSTNALPQATERAPAMSPPVVRIELAARDCRPSRRLGRQAASSSPSPPGLPRVDA